MQRHRRRSFMFGMNAALYLKIGAVAVAVIVLMLLIFSPKSSNVSSMDSAEIRQVIKRGTLRVGIRSDLPGFAYNGEGLEVELANKLGAMIFPDSQTPVTFVEMASSFMDARFSDSTIDVALMIVPQGKNTSKYTYSEPYYYDRCVFIVAKGNEHATMNSTNIGVLANSVCENRLNSYIENSDAKIGKTTYSNYEMMIKSMLKGKLNAAVIPGVYYKIYAEKFAIAEHNEKLDGIGYSLVCSIETPAFAEIFNSCLAELKASGELDSLISKYIGG